MRDGGAQTEDDRRAVISDQQCEDRCAFRKMLLWRPVLERAQDDVEPGAL